MLVRVGAAVAAGSALLSVLVGISRTALAMARGGDLPRGLGRVGPRGTPWRADLAVGDGRVVAVLAGPAAAIALSACSVLVYYAVINLAALRLPRARRWPALDRRARVVLLPAARPAAAAGPGADHRRRRWPSGWTAATFLRGIGDDDRP